MFEGLFLGILGCCQVLPSLKPVFIRVSGFSMVLHNVCFDAYNASILGAFCVNFSLNAITKHMFLFSVISSKKSSDSRNSYHQITLIILCKHRLHLPTAKIEIIYFKDFILYSQIVFVIIFALIIGV